MAAVIPECTLGSTGITTTALGIGGYIGELEHPGATASERRDAAVAAVQRAAGLGIRHFDTSPAYGSEGGAQKLLGLGLRSLTGEQRAGITLSTKAGTHPQRHHRYDRDSILWSVDESFRLLFSDHVEVLLVHDPAGHEHMDEALAPGGAVEALEELKEQGAIGAIGLGVQSHALQRRAIDSGRFDVILPSYDYHLTRTSAAPLLRDAAARGIGVINASPYNSGILAGLHPSESARRRGASGVDLQAARAVWDWCRERGVDIGALAVQFSFRCPDVDLTLVGPRTAAEVEENVRHATAEIPAEVWEEFGPFQATLPGMPQAGGTP